TSRSSSASAAPAIREVQPVSEETSTQMIINRLISTETLLVQGIENLIQREVVARINELNTRVDHQEQAIKMLNQRMDKISEQIDHHNKGLMVIL
ncbi:MAG: response regulator, partial [Pseudanabaena sp.]